MPTYQYRCLKCKYEFEIVQKMVDDPLAECPECKGKIKRLIGAGAGIIFKGDGFYSTDYRSDSYKKQAEKENKTTKSTSEKKKKNNTKESKSTSSSG